jgi:hypothetical protein
MIQQLLLALALSSITVIIHVVGTVRVLLPMAKLWGRAADRSTSPRPVATLTGLVSGLLFLHLIEMAMWAVTLAMGGILPDFETSLYYSLKSYTTVGYGDVLPPQTWRLVGPIEAAVGVLMLGLSTSAIVATVQRLYSTRPETSMTRAHH